MKLRQMKLEYVTLDKFQRAMRRCVCFYNEPFYDEKGHRKSNLYKGDGYTWTDHKGNIHLIFKDEDANWKNKHWAIDAYQAENEKIAEDKTTKAQEGMGAQAIKDINKFAKKTEEEYQLDPNYVRKLLGIKDMEDIECSAYQWFRKGCENIQYHNVYGYDLNSCYPFFLTQYLPTGLCLGQGRVQDDEIGFIEDVSATGTVQIQLVLEGYAQYRFKKKKYECFKLWAQDGYEKKKKDKKYKTRFNAMLGNMKYHNIFIRAAVLGYARMYIEGLKDENTIMQTVDSIVSLKERPELDIGTEMGQFKIEHQGDFIFKSASIKKWNDDKALHSGLGSSQYKNEDELFDHPQYYLVMNKNRFDVEFRESTTTIIDF